MSKQKHAVIAAISAAITAKITFTEDAHTKWATSIADKISKKCQEDVYRGFPGLGVNPLTVSKSGYILPLTSRRANVAVVLLLDGDEEGNNFTVTGFQLTDGTGRRALFKPVMETFSNDADLIDSVAKAWEDSGHFKDDEDE